MLIAMLISGCNAFEGFDHSLNSDNREAQADEARLELNSGNYEKAEELYRILIEEGSVNDEIRRGHASALAGIAGFNMFKILDILQNDLIPAGTAPVFFKAAKTITNLEKLEEAIEEMNNLAEVSNDDRIFSGIMTAIAATMRIWEKYDTNLNKRLDSPDQIDFDTNDDKTILWSPLYIRFTNDSIWSLERTFIRLATGFNGRGESWTFVSPIQGIRITGEYTEANRKIVLAISDYLEILQEANGYFDISETQFKSAITSLDGEYL